MNFDELGYAGKYLPHSSILSMWDGFWASISGLGATIVMEKKFPDVSFYQGTIDWNKMGDAAIIRILQNTWIDTQFARNYAEAKARNVRRGIYLFYDDRASPDVQADLLIGLLKDDHPEMEVFVDWEKSYGGNFGGLANVVRCMKRIEAGLPGVKVGIYTGYYWFKDHSNSTTNAAEYEYLKDKALWLAWYTSNPAYVLIPAPWNKVTHWQYGTPAIGSQYGVETIEIDMNYFNGTPSEFQTKYGGTTPPPDGEIHTTPYPNTEFHQIYRYGTRISTVVIGGGYKWHVTKFGLKTVSQAAGEFGALIATNGGDYSIYGPVGLHASEGVVDSLQSEWEPWVNFSSSQVASIERFDSKVPKFNSIAGKRILVDNGAVSPLTSDAWYVPEPRTLAGVTAQGKAVLIVVDGRQSVNGFWSDGITLFQGAELLLNYGCIYGIDLDGGGSSAMWITDKIVNVPIDENIPGKERSVGDHILLLPSGGGTVMRYSAISSTNDMSLRFDHDVLTAKLITIPRGTTVYGDNLWIATDNSTYHRTGDKWLQTTYGGKIGWVAIIHLGVTYMTLTDTTPPPSGNVEVRIDSIEITSSGNTLVRTVLYTPLVDGVAQAQKSVVETFAKV